MVIYKLTITNVFSYYNSEEGYSGGDTPNVSTFQRDSYAQPTYKYSINRYSQEESASRSNSSATLTGNRPGFKSNGADSDGFTSSSTVIPQIYNSKQNSLNKIHRNTPSTSSSTQRNNLSKNFEVEVLPYSQCLSPNSMEGDYEAQLAATGRRYDSRPYSTDGYSSSAIGGIASSTAGVGAFSTPTPTYEEYQRTPTLYNIANDGSLVSTCIDYKPDDELRKSDNSYGGQYYFNENYADELANDS